MNSNTHEQSECGRTDPCRKRNGSVGLYQLTRPAKRGATKAYTLVEIIVYVAIVSTILLIIIQFSWNIFDSSARVDVSRELTQNARFTLERFTQDVRMAENILLKSSVFGSHPGSLVLDMPGGDQNITYATVVDGTIRRLQRQVGSNPAVDLTSDRVDVTNFILRNRTRSNEPKNVKLELTISSVSSGQDPSRDRDLSIETSISLRRQ